jgi:hypothetical protein
MRLRLFFLLCLFFGTACAQPGSEGGEWKTNFDKRSISLDEVISGGPPKDGIPAIDAPRFVSADEAAGWLQPQEPVIAIRIGDAARAYPLQILTWHEIVNDELAGTPVAVTFCPLCYAAVAYDRRVGGTTHRFGVSGKLRHSDMIMFDRETESFWQQLTGEAVVGDLLSAKLTPVPAQIVSFAQFRAGYPAGDVLSRETGHSRAYGRNPYVGYDDIDERPFLYRGPFDGRLRPMEKVVTVSLGGVDIAYPHGKTRAAGVINDDVGGESIAIFHGAGAVSALDEAEIHASREIGSTGVFHRTLDGRTLTFRYERERFVDAETGSVWSVTGQATEGPLAGRRLEPLPHGNYFAFAWFAFKPETEVYGVP